MSPHVEPVDCFEGFKLLTYSLEGDEEKHDQALYDICKNLHIDPRGKLKSEIEKKSYKKSTNTNPNKQNKSDKKDPVTELSKKVEKIDLKDQEDKEIEKALKESKKTDPETLLKCQQLVFKKMAELKRRKNIINFADIKKATEKDMEESVLLEILDIFDEEGKITYDKVKNHMMMT